MLAVALFHPCRLKDWSTNNGTRLITRSLNSIVLDEQLDSDCLCSNNYREEIANSLRGKYGMWRFIPAAALLESALISLDYETLSKVHLLPLGQDSTHSLLWESALAEFLARDHSFQSTVSVTALECASSVVLEYIRRVLVNTRTTMASGESLLLMEALNSTKHFFYSSLLRSRTAIEVKDTLVRVVEDAVAKRYKTSSTQDDHNICHYSLVQHSSTATKVGAECLARRLRGAPVSDSERFRFLADMAIHFRAVCNVASRDGWYKRQSPDHEPLTSVDPAGELSLVFSFLIHPPQIGSDISLANKNSFPFAAQVYNDTAAESASTTSASEKEHSQSLSENMIFRSRSTGLLLVVDPTVLMVVKPLADASLGTVVCSVPIVDVVAAAVDDERLHVAVRHENVGFLIKNGNMLLTFESSGTCLVASEYLERCRKLLHSDLYDKIVDLFSVTKPNESEHQATTIHHSRTF